MPLDPDDHTREAFSINDLIWKSLVHIRIVDPWTRQKRPHL